MRDLCDGWLVWRYFLRTKIAIRIAICEKHVRERFSLSRYKNRVGCERACVTAISLGLSPLLSSLGSFVASSSGFVFFPFKAGTNRVCTWLLVRTLRTYLPCMTFLLIARVFFSFSFTPLFFLFPFSVLTFFIHLYKIGFFFPSFFSKHKLVFFSPKHKLVFYFIL